MGWFKDIATFDQMTITCDGSTNTFLAIINENGNWQSVVKASGTDDVLGIDQIIDVDGNCYVVGYFNETATFGQYSLTCSDNYFDIFVAKLDINGNWIWATSAGGSSWDQCNGIVLDALGNIYVTGFYCETANFGSYTLNSVGLEDIFVAKLDSDGNWLWANSAGGSGTDFGQKIKINNSGVLRVIGNFSELSSFDTIELVSNGSTDIFVTELDSNGNWIWASSAGGNHYDEGQNIRIDNNGNSYITGFYYDNANFGNTQLTGYGVNDIFVAKIDNYGNWVWAKQAGGEYGDKGFGIAIDNSANTYLTGSFQIEAYFGSDQIYRMVVLTFFLLN